MKSRGKAHCYCDGCLSGQRDFNTEMKLDYIIDELIEGRARIIDLKKFHNAFNDLTDSLEFEA